MKALAMEILFDKLSITRIIAVEPKKGEEKIIKFNNFSAMLNILFDFAELNNSK